MVAPADTPPPPAAPAAPAGLVLDVEDQCLWRNGERLALPPKAFAVLCALHERAGRLVTKNELLDTAWPGTFVGDAVLKVAISQLRELLGDDARRPWLIETVHRRGYRLLAPIATAAGAAAAAAPPAAGVVHAADDIVGRDAALAQLMAAWEQARTGKRQVLFITGDPGIGKTALLDLFARRLGDEPPAVAPLVGRGHCVEEFGSTEAFLPFLDAMDTLLRPAGAGELRDALRRCAPSWLAQFPWLLTPADGPLLERERHGATRERMLRQLAAALEIGSAAAPIVLLLEDLHWADPSSVQLLAFLAQRRHEARLLVVATFRPVDVIVAAHPLRETRQRLVTAGLCTEVPLWFLEEADVGAFLQRRLGGPAATSLAALLHRRSSGNPLFLRSLVDHLRDRGTLERDEHGWRLAAASGPEEEVPGAIREVIEHGLARLAPDDVALLEAASVAGGPFACAGVAACLGTDEARIEDACERLARRGDLLRAAGAVALACGAPGSRYEIVHALIQNVLYRRMAAARRMTTHQRWGLWLEAQGGSPGELAHHFALAGTAADAARAIAYARAAARRATAVFAHEEAVRQLDGALHLARSDHGRDPAVEGELLVELAAAQQRAGQVVAAEATFRAAAAHARARGDAPLLARAAVGIGHGYQRLGMQDPEVPALLEEALQRLGPGDHPLRALALAHLDYGLGSVPGSWQRRQGLAREALAMARRLGDPELLVPVLLHTRWAFRGPQSIDEWRADAAEVESLLGRVDDGEQLLMLRSLRVGDHLELGDLDAAERALAEFADAAEEAQLPWFLWLASGMACKIALLRGRFSESERLIEQTLATGRRTDHPNVDVLHAGQTTLLRIVQGDLAGLAPLVRAGVEAYPQVVTWRAVRAYLAAELGDIDDARAQIEVLAEGDFAALPRDTSWFVLVGFASIACALTADRQRAAALYELALPYADGFTGVGASLLSLGHMGRYLGWLAATTGRRREAAAHFERAIERTEAMGALPWLALSRFDYARVLATSRSRADRQRARELLAEASAGAASIGMAGWLERMQAAAASA